MAWDALTISMTTLFLGCDKKGTWRRQAQTETVLLIERIICAQFCCLFGEVLMCNDYHI